MPDQAFAAQAGVGVSTLHAWRRRAAARPTSPPTPFVAVPNLLAAGPPAPADRLHWPGGLSLELRAYLLDDLPKLGDWPINRVAELTPTAWQAAHKKVV